MIILSANRLSKGYGTDVILTDVSFHVNAGDRVGIVGRNGAGKTTLLKLLTGELTADEGEFFVLTAKEPLSVKSTRSSAKFTISKRRLSR